MNTSPLYNATVINRIDVTPELLIISVKPDAGVPEFHPGQYVALGLIGSAPRVDPSLPEDEVPHPEKLIKRAYSIGSSPQEREHFEFYVAVVPTGSLTSRLALIKPGDRIFAQPKVTGTFTLDGVPPERNLVLISTGTGLAPFMSMVRTESTWSPGRSITIVHGVRYPQDFAYAEELRSLEQSRSTFRYLPIASRAPAGWEGRKGRVQVLFNEKIIQLVPAVDHVFMCGNPAMIEELEAQLISTGYSVHSKKNPGNLHLEKYW